jgi:hypothetical protein
MRLFVRLLFLVSILSSSIGNATPIITDTTFFVKHRGNDFRQEVFIDTSRSSAYYDKLSAFEVSAEGLDLYQDVISELSKVYGSPSHVAFHLPETRWLPAICHDGKIYLYAPCDWLFHQPVMLTDSTIVTWGEAAYPEFIRSVKKVGDSYTFVTQSLGGDLKGEISQTLHLIDEPRGVAILQTSDSEDKSDLRLLIAQSHMRDFPIVVNNCFDRKSTEWHPEVTDLRKLLKR